MTPIFRIRYPEINKIFITHMLSCSVQNVRIRFLSLVDVILSQLTLVSVYKLSLWMHSQHVYGCIDFTRINSFIIVYERIANESSDLHIFYQYRRLAYVIR